MAYSLSTEDRLILLLSRRSLSAEAREAADILFKDGSVDFKRLLNLASVNGVTPLLSHNLKSAAGVPAEFLEKLWNDYLLTLSMNLRKIPEIMGVVDLLGKSNVVAVPLKGPISSDLIFDDPGLYPSGDIDLLVRPTDLEKARIALQMAGYLPDRSNEADMRRSSYHINFQREGSFIELHWTLAFRYFDVPPDFWWQGAGTVSYRSMALPVLSADRYLLYAIFRLFNHAFRPLRFFVFAAEIINRKGDEIDWTGLISNAKTFRMERLLFFTLRLLHEFLGVKIPEEALISRLYGYSRLKGLVLSGLFQEVKRVHFRKFLYTTIQDSPHDVLKVLFGRVFPHLSEVRLRYGLPAGSKSVYLYYLLNPILLVARKEKRVKR
jgi:Uncharacterised nucleotidyltransferase